MGSGGPGGTDTFSSIHLKDFELRTTNMCYVLKFFFNVIGKNMSMVKT